MWWGSREGGSRRSVIVNGVIIRVNLIIVISCILIIVIRDRMGRSFMCDSVEGRWVCYLERVGRGDVPVPAVILV